MSRTEHPEKRPDRQSFLFRLANRSYRPWATPYLELLARPLSVLIFAALTALLCGWLVAPQGLVLFGAITTVIVIGCVWPWINLRGVDCQLRFVVSRTEEGKPADMEIRIANRWPWPVWGLVIEGGFDLPSNESSTSQTPQVALARIGGWSRAELRWPFVPKVRGSYPTEQPRLVTEFPFGLWKAHKAVTVLSNLIVWPLRFQLPPLLMPCGKQSWSGHPSETTTGRFGQRSTVREYRLGDSMRQIHWAKTALYNKLVSYDREGIAVAEATLSLDTHPALHRGSGPNASVEWTMRIAASICEVLLAQGVGVNVVAHAGHYRQHAQGDRTGLLDWMATLGTDDTSKSAEAERVRKRRLSENLSIHITTDHSCAISHDSIVLATEWEFSDGSLPAQIGQSWMTIVNEDEIANQVRRGWQRGLRRRRHAV